MGNRLGEQRGTTSKAVVSSTNLIRALQSSKRELAKTEKRKGPSLVPWGRPPLARFHVEVEKPILTDCSRHQRKVLIHLIIAGFTWSFWSSSTTTLWSTKSKPFSKSAKNILMQTSRIPVINLVANFLTLYNLSKSQFGNPYKIALTRNTLAWPLHREGYCSWQLRQLRSLVYWN